MHEKKWSTAGVSIATATKALILVHGRGASANDILSLANYLDVEGYALVAPQATNNTWYPHSFLAPPAQNEPWLSSAVALLDDVVRYLQEQGLTAGQIYFAGFSQGACLMLEYVTRHATKWGGIIAFTGGLIGDKVYRENYKGAFAGTPVFIGSANPDFHVPAERVYATANILREMGADVNEKLYANMGHTINEDELTQANLILSAG